MKPSTSLEQLYHITFTSEIATLLDEGASFVTFPPHYLALREGEKCKHVYIIVKGLIRAYFIDSLGNDVNHCFSAEKGFFASEGFRTNTFSTHSVETLETCHCIQLPYTVLHAAMKKDAQLTALVNQFYLEQLEDSERRSKELVVTTAEERYLNFCAEYPHLLDRIPLKHIASHMGIRAGSLSRIRRNLKIK